MINQILRQQPSAQVAIETPTNKISYRQLIAHVDAVSRWLVSQEISTLLLDSDNVPEWIYIDLACQKAGVIFVPVPRFFSQQQRENVIKQVAPDLIIQPQGTDKDAEPFIFSNYQFIKLPKEKQNITPHGTSKITFTSGSTGNPKGVCLNIENQYRVAKSLAERIAIKQPRHFSLLSFSTLLENIAGIYAPLIAGGTICMLTDNERGFNGASITSPQSLLQAMTITQPHSIILVPELLQFLLHAAQNGWSMPSSFAFIAVGGSKVAPALLTKAREYGLPVYQGYGLSECASVVSLETATELTHSAAGKVLPHLKAEIVNGELIVSGNAFLGYLSDANSWYQDKVNTGDIATLHNNTIDIIGRTSNLIINSFGRNISPEWVESELLATGVFSQVVILGDAKPFLVALVSPADPQLSVQTAQEVINRVNITLPEYAQIRNFHILAAPLSLEKGQLTSNGRPKRKQINQDFTQEIDQLFSVNYTKENEYEFI